MSDVRWMLYRDRFPFGIGDELGPINAPDKATAEQRGKLLHGVRCVARSLLTLEVEAREKQYPLVQRRPHGTSPKGGRR